MKIQNLLDENCKWEYDSFGRFSTTRELLFPDKNRISQTRNTFRKYTRNIVKSRKTRNTTEKSNSRSHRQRMCISLVILLRELLPAETRFVLFSPRISQFSSNNRRELSNSRGESRQLGSVQLYASRCHSRSMWVQKWVFLG